MHRQLETHYATALPVRVFAGDDRTALDGVIADINYGGLALRVPTWGEDERLRVELTLHGDRCFLACAMVAQTEAEDAIVLHCAFAQPSQRQQRFVEALVRSQDAPAPTPLPLHAP